MSLYVKSLIPPNREKALWLVKIDSGFDCVLVFAEEGVYSTVVDEPYFIGTFNEVLPSEVFGYKRGTIFLAEYVKREVAVCHVPSMIETV